MDFKNWLLPVLLYLLLILPLSAWLARRITRSTGRESLKANHPAELLLTVACTTCIVLAYDRDRSATGWTGFAILAAASVLSHVLQCCFGKRESPSSSA